MEAPRASGCAEHELTREVEPPGRRLVLLPETRRAHLEGVGTALAIACLVAVVVLELTRRILGWPTPHELAATPSALAAGKVWLLVTSAFIVNGPPVLELIGLVGASVLLIRLHGAKIFWLVAAIGHVGSTLAAYAGVGLLWLAAPDLVEDTLERPDYGISGAWLGVLGALCASTFRSAARGDGGALEAIAGVVAFTAAVIGFAFFPLLSGIEHLLAFVFGAIVLLVASDDRRPATSRLRVSPVKRSGSGVVSHASRRDTDGVSLDNIELARRGYEAFNRGDVESVLELVDPDFELQSGADVPDSDVYRKHEGFLANIREWRNVIEELHFEPEEFVEAGDRLLVLVRASGRGRGSGAEFEQRQAHVWVIRDRRAVGLAFYSNRSDAERAAGLRPSWQDARAKREKVDQKGETDGTAG